MLGTEYISHMLYQCYLLIRRITISLRPEKTTKITKSNSQPIAIVPNNKIPQ